MKWPKQLTFVRHAQSEYNVLRTKKEQDPLYEEFKHLYKLMGRPTFTREGMARLRELAAYVESTYSLGRSDRQTRITHAGREMALATGKRLREKVNFPDVVFVSPYDRTRETWELLKFGWPQLGSVKVYYDERIREMDHGLSLLYNDWRVFHVHHPEQKKLHDLLGSYDYRYPNGENVPDTRMRVRDWRSTVIREFFEKNVLVITHHITILAFRADQERLDPREYKRLDMQEKPINCGVTIYDGIPSDGSKGRLALSIYNEKLY